jgi:hypothetical protein
MFSYRVFYQETGKELVHNGLYSNKKDALRFYINFKKEYEVDKIMVVKLDEKGDEEVLIQYEK